MMDVKKLPLASFGLSVISGLFLFYGQLVVGLFFIALWALLDVFYLVNLRKRNFVTRFEDFLSTTVNTGSSLVLLLGLIFGGFVTGELGLLAVVGVFLVHYTEIQCAAIGLNRSGIERPFKIGFLVFVLVMGVLEVSVGLTFFGFGFVWWGVLVISIVSILISVFLAFTMYFKLSGRKIEDNSL
ncbi:hypothetical protein [Methanonatronarchaeum sp. AMET-Sl]|uniref:hypothetical protein n=1 Tax=Methanonatronarchaeum sp. AMET-Sl TaxID=3037654 RepID=UPI00244E33B5|nr:hypothetical protein [Methanonatronarchaeum sp. AMET-Sl]WGI17365.1 hypothetical protein QEN48_07640 [Methanonatronarchaeum sp. AMET-Sl]